MNKLTDLDYFKVDDITWNDLSMDRVYERINFSMSSIGSDYSRDALQTLYLSNEKLLKRDSRSNYFSADKDKLKKIQKVFKELGFTKKYKFIDYIFRMEETEQRSNIPHFILIILLVAFIVLLFFNALIGIIGIVVMFVINISTYFSAKSKIEAYFICTKYLARMIITAEKVLRIRLDDSSFSEINRTLSDMTEKFSNIKRGSWLLTNSVSGSLVDVIMDYVRMLFHVDIIKFNNIRRTVINNKESVQQLYEALGEIELACNICLFRENCEVFCKPDFSSDNLTLKAKNLIHPLVKEPVGNNYKLSEKHALLLTGSNASGKSTFLKSFAISQILAQTIFTCLAEDYNCSFFRVFTSMALNDNILNNESFFVVELKSLKRIIDNLGSVPVLCVVDEVLRGTNTKERIAAATSFLKYLSDSNAVVLAATHDIELTDLLSDDMDNYHFSESVTDNHVSFDYKIKQGPSDTRNALKLMAEFGFSEEILNNAYSLV